MSEFAPALAKTLTVEGGFVDDSDDSGGRTNYGITQRTYDRWRKQWQLETQDVVNISDREVSEIYYDYYWVPSRAQEITAQPVAEKYFDLCVNMGLVWGCRLLQFACIDCGHGITPDGKIGTLTLLAVNSCHPVSLLDLLKHRAIERYERLVQERPSSAKFLKGWLKRAAA